MDNDSSTIKAGMDNTGNTTDETGLGQQMEAPTKPKLVIRTEVYSRVVGYLRPIRDWNQGKLQEFEDRVVYEVPTTYSETD